MSTAEVNFMLFGFLCGLLTAILLSQVATGQAAAERRAKLEEEK